MRLHVGPVGAEELLRALDGDGLGDVHKLAAAVVALARVALGVLVGQLAALRDHDLLAHVVLGGDQFDVVFLAAVLETNGVPEFGVGLGKQVGVEHGGWARGQALFYQREPPQARRDPPGQSEI